MLPLFAHAAATKPWVTLTNCHYVETKDADGDSFRVRTATNEFNVRLYFVDAPEATMTYAERVRQQAEHFHVTLDASLKTGAAARERTRELLRSPFVVHTRWATAGGRGREPRYYAIVTVDGRTLGEILVSEGLAQAKGVTANLPDGRKSAAHLEQLLALEEAAKANRAGAWTNATIKEP